MKKLFILLSFFCLCLSVSAGEFTQWINTAGAIQTIAVGTGNRFQNVATFHVTVARPSTVVVTGVTETFLDSSNSGSSHFRSMAGIYRVALGNYQSPAIRFSNAFGGGSGISSSSIQMPLTATLVANNVPAGSYDAAISIYGFDDNYVNFLPVRYLTKQIIVQVIPL